jgi:hypothetical protein
VDSRLPSGLAHREMVGRPRDEVWEYAEQFSELAKAIPSESPRG